MHECTISVGVEASPEQSVVKLESNFEHKGADIRKKETFSSYTVSRISSHDGDGEVTNIVFSQQDKPLSLRLTSHSNSSRVSIAYKYDFRHVNSIDPRDAHRHPVYVVTTINDKHNIVKGLIRELVMLRDYGSRADNAKVADDVRFSAVESINVFEA